MEMVDFVSYHSDEISEWTKIVFTVFAYLPLKTFVELFEPFFVKNNVVFSKSLEFHSFGFI